MATKESAREGANATLLAAGSEKERTASRVERRTRAIGLKATIGDLAYEAMVNRVLELRSEAWSFLAVARELSTIGVRLSDGKTVPIKISDKEVARLEKREAAREYEAGIKKRDEMRRQALMRIDRQIRDLWDSWHKSKRAFGEKTEDITEELDEVPVLAPVPEFNTNPRATKMVAKKKKVKTRGHQREGHVAYQNAITQLQRLRCELLHLIEPDQGFVQNVEQSIYYCPTEDPIPGALKGRPFEFDPPKIVPNLAADEIPPEMLPRENMAQELEAEELERDIPPVSGGMFGPTFT